jgi:flavin reductase (DIM6/NTAB) family NADH-FMN oxidoreductase RutF
MLDPAARKRLLRSFTYGLLWLSSEHEGEHGIFTVNWVSQASFEPPLLMVSVEKVSSTLPLIRESGRFVIGPFRADQRELAGDLGRPKSKAGDKITAYALDTVPMESGGFALRDSLGGLACQVRSESDAGDSVVFIAEVVEARVFGEGDPLTMSAAGFRHFG